MTPADELRTAAEALQKLATAATQLPWRKHDADYPHLVIQAPEGVPTADCAGMISTNLTPNEDADAAYIATMHPGVGKALAGWLETTATSLTASTHPDWQDCVAADALAVARAILGQEQP